MTQPKSRSGIIIMQRNKSQRSSSQSTQRITVSKEAARETHQSQVPLQPEKELPVKTSPHVSLSLPRINELSSQQLLGLSTIVKQLPLANIHRVKWSIAPRCLLQQHESKEILYVCINPKCQERTRLACEACFFGCHSQHSQEFLAIDEIKNASFDKLRFWPFDKRFKQMHEFLCKHENYVNNLVQDINATFDTMTRSILSEINKLKLELLRQVDTFYVGETAKKLFVEEVTKQLEECFELRKIRRTVNRLFSKEVKHSVFLLEMQRLLNSEKVLKNRERLEQYFVNADKGKDMTFDKNTFLKKEAWIIDQVRQQKQTLEVKDVKVFSELAVDQMLPQALTYLEGAAKQFHELVFRTVKFQDGSSYTGFFSDEKKEIAGVRYYKNGLKYLGQWKTNSRSGWGTLINEKSGFRYSGQWKEDRRNGYGRQQSFTGTYQGQFKNDKKQGFGVYIENGTRLEISWKNDKKHGKGKLIRSNGDETDVYFLNGIEAPAPNHHKGGPAPDLKELSKRFSKKSQSTKDKD